MFPVSYLRAKSLKHAAEVMAANPEAKLLAGGMTLLPTLKQRLARPSHLVDIGGWPVQGGEPGDRRSVRRNFAARKLPH